MMQFLPQMNGLSHIDILQSNVLVDKTYGTNEIFDYIQVQDSTYTFPPKSNIDNPCCYDWWIYKEHYFVNAFFKSSSISDKLLLFMISSLPLFLPLSILFQSSFCLNDTYSLNFQEVLVKRKIFSKDSYTY